VVEMDRVRKVTERQGNRLPKVIYIYIYIYIYENYIVVRETKTLPMAEKQ
jgi:hypothetical protein